MFVTLTTGDNKKEVTILEKNILSLENVPAYDEKCKDFTMIKCIDNNVIFVNESVDQIKSLINKNTKTPIQNAVEVLTESLKNDEGYWISWQSNIAMSFIDEFNFNKSINEISNKAAYRFLNLLCNGDYSSND